MSENNEPIFSVLTGKDVPYNVTAVAQSDLDDCDISMTVSWNAPTDTGGLSIGYYEVEHSVDNGSSWLSIGSVGPFGNPETSLTWLNPPYTQTYIFRVRTQYTNAEYGEYSNSSASVSPTPLGLVAPFLVGGINGSYDPETGLGNGVGDGTVYLQWAPASKCDGGSYISRHRVEYSSDSGSTWTVFAADSSEADSSGTPRITVNNLTNGTAYIFRVAGVGDLPGGGTYFGAYSSSSGAFTPTA